MVFIYFKLDPNDTNKTTVCRSSFMQFKNNRLLNTTLVLKTYRLSSILNQFLRHISNVLLFSIKEHSYFSILHTQNAAYISIHCQL